MGHLTLSVFTWTRVSFFDLFFKVSSFCVCASKHHNMISENKISLYPEFEKIKKRFCSIEKSEIKLDTHMPFPGSSIGMASAK